MKEKILHTAAEMFIQFGFKSITMDDIAQKWPYQKRPFTVILPIRRLWWRKQPLLYSQEYVPALTK